MKKNPKRIRNRLDAVWFNMMSRCYNKKSKNYHRWGGRGIIVCEEWKNIKNFTSWCLSNGWNKKLSVDRINNEGNYESTNVRFISKGENCRNTDTIKLNWDLVREIRNVKLLTPQIKLEEIAKAYFVSYMTIWFILNNKTWKE